MAREDAAASKRLALQWTLGRPHKGPLLRPASSWPGATAPLSPSQRGEKYGQREDAPGGR